jgi:glycolate oxidase
VARIIAAGIVPAGLEMMDQPAIRAVEEYVHAGYDLSAEAILLAESDGTPEEVAEEVAAMQAVLEDSGATDIRVSRDEAERLQFWAGRKAAFPAVGRIMPDYLCMDGTIPLGKLGQVLVSIGQIGDTHGLKVANIFHAGDGNLHPLILYNANDPVEAERAEQAGADILELCVKVGGCLTGEHGVGIEKRDLMRVQYTESDLLQQMRVKTVFDPEWLLNPHKVFPLDGREAAYEPLPEAAE